MWTREALHLAKIGRANVATERIPLATGASPPITGDVCAAAMYEAQTLILIWCNTPFESFVVEPYRTDGPVGHAYLEISPVGYAMHGQDMEEVARTGEAKSGKDRIFSVEDGVVTYNWTIERPQPGILLALIRREEPCRD